MADHEGVTQLLHRIDAGDRSAMEELLPLVYAELRRLAANALRRERHDHTLQPTALVHEVYLKLAAETSLNSDSKSQFLGIAARAMRQVLVDHSRKHRAQKRGGGAKVQLDENLPLRGDAAPEILEINRALEELEALDPRKARVIELKYFGGMTTEEIAQVTGLSTATVVRDVRMAQSWIRRALRGETANE